MQIAAFRCQAHCFHIRMEGNHKIYSTIWLWVDLFQSPLLLHDGGGEGCNFTCAESQIVACWKMGLVTIVSVIRICSLNKKTVCSSSTVPIFKWFTPSPTSHYSLFCLPFIFWRFLGWFWYSLYWPIRSSSNVVIIIPWWIRAYYVQETTQSCSAGLKKMSVQSSVLDLLTCKHLIMSLSLWWAIWIIGEHQVWVLFVSCCTHWHYQYLENAYCI